MSDIENAVAVAQQEFLDRLNDLPVSLSVNDIAGLLGICPSTAYKLIDQDNFPKVKMPGIKRVVIPKVRFVEWYLKNEIHVARTGY